MFILPKNYGHLTIIFTGYLFISFRKFLWARDHRIYGNFIIDSKLLVPRNEKYSGNIASLENIYLTQDVNWYKKKRVGNKICQYHSKVFNLICLHSLIVFKSVSFSRVPFFTGRRYIGVFQTMYNLTQDIKLQKALTQFPLEHENSNSLT